MADLTLLLQNPTEAQKDMMLSPECMAASWKDVFAERDEAREAFAGAQSLYRRKAEQVRRFAKRYDQARAEVERLREALEGDNVTAKRVYALLEQRDRLREALEMMIAAYAPYSPNTEVLRRAREALRPANEPLTNCDAASPSANPADPKVPLSNIPNCDSAPSDEGEDPCPK